MVKTDVIETTNDLIKKYETIFQAKNQIQIENENMKAKAEVVSVKFMISILLVEYLFSRL